MATTTSGDFTLHASPSNSVNRTNDDALVISEVDDGPLRGPDGDYSYNKSHRITGMGDNYIIASGSDGNNKVRYGLFKRTGTDWVTVATVTDATAGMNGGTSSEWTYVEMATVNDATALHAWRDPTDDQLHLQVVIRDGDSLSFGAHIVPLVNYSGHFEASPVSIVPLNETEILMTLSGWTTEAGNYHQHLVHVTRSGANLTVNNDQVLNNNSEEWVGLGAVAISETQVAYAIGNANTTYGNAIIGWLLTRSSGGSVWTLSDTATIRALPFGNGRVENDKWSFSPGASGRAGRVLSDAAAFAWLAFDTDSATSTPYQYVETGIMRVSGTSIVSTDFLNLLTTTQTVQNYDIDSPFIAAWKDTGIWVAGHYSHDDQDMHFYRFSTDGASITQQTSATFLDWSSFSWGQWLEALGAEGGGYGAYFEAWSDGWKGTAYGRLMTFGTPPPDATRGPVQALPAIAGDRLGVLPTKHSGSA